MSATPSIIDARATYEAFAPVYDLFNHQYKYRSWTLRLLARAEGHGLPSGKRLLDVGCGTGLSFVALLEAGWSVTGCDLSPAMLERARERFGSAAGLKVADMRRLPCWGEFDLIWALNDAVNYLLDASELRAALEGMAVNLARDGILLFDLNTLSTFRDAFCDSARVEVGGHILQWEGLTDPGEVEPGGVSRARFLDSSAAGVREHIHQQRHFTGQEVARAAEAAGLRILEILGVDENDDGALKADLDESRHSKAVYICCSGRG